MFKNTGKLIKQLKVFFAILSTVNIVVAACFLCLAIFCVASNDCNYFNVVVISMLIKTIVEIVVLTLVYTVINNLTSSAQQQEAKTYYINDRRIRR